jgi:hypothetical protein
LRIVSDDDGLRLTRSNLAVLQALIATGVSTDAPESPIYARKSSLARLAGVSARTVFRALLCFEESGLIYRQQQNRNQEGCLDISEIVLTPDFIQQLRLSSGNSQPNLMLQSENIKEKLCTIADNKTKEEQLTNLHCCPVHLDTFPIRETLAQQVDEEGESAADFMGKESCLSAPAQPVENSRSQPVLAHGLAHGTVYKEQNLEQKDSVYNQSPAATSDSAIHTQSAYVRHNGRSIARELFWLIEEKRLIPSALFLLQKEAKAKGQRLSDFVALRCERLRELATEADCFRYLRALIRQDMDAKQMLTEQTTRQRQLRRVEVRKTRHKSVVADLKQFDGKKLVRPETGEICVIHANAEHASLMAADGATYLGTSLRLTRPMICAIVAGKWLPAEPQQANKESVSGREAFFARFRRSAAVCC